MTDPMTLYKLMILYLLRKTSHFITEDRISEFFLGHEYTNWFTLKTALSELLEVGFLRSETVLNATRYSITAKGSETCDLFGRNISAEIIADMDRYLKENQFELRSEVSVSADWHRNSGSEYIVRCSVTEGKSPLIALELSVPDEAQAQMMCSRWRDSQEDIYTFILKKLLGGSSE